MKTLKIWSILEKSGFFEWMRLRFQQAKHKNPGPNLSDYSLEAFFRHLYEEIGELEKALDLYGSDRILHNPDFTALFKELGDVANMCGLVFAKLKEEEG